MGYMDELLTREYFDLVYEGERLFEEGSLVEARNRFMQATELFGKVVENERSRLERLTQRVTEALIEQNVREGDRLKEDGELEAARERYAVALSLSTDEGERDELLIKMEYQAPLQPTGTFPETLQRLFADLDRKPDSPEALYNLATELAIEGYPMEAVRYLERLILLTPDDPDPCYRLGNALTDIKAYERARRAFEKARELGYDETEIEYRLGVLERKRGNHEAAIDHFRKVLELDAEHLDATRNLAEIYEADEKPNHAIDYYTKAGRLDPEDAAIFLKLGELYELTGNLERAFQCWREAVSVDPDSEAAGYAREHLDELGGDEMEDA